MQDQQLTQSVTNEERSDLLCIVGDLQEQLDVVKYRSYELDYQVSMQLDKLHNVISNGNENVIKMVMEEMLHLVTDLVNAENEIKSLMIQLMNRSH